MPHAPGQTVAGQPGREFRPEIQGLRALAVLAVLVYHLWPTALTGGYVGVDVFFVLSGFLITRGLLDEAVATGRIAVTAFYARRIRRLLPAATGVLVVAALLLPWLPSTRWEAGTAEIVASALYVQNWWLAARAVDYLASAEAPGLLTHFWSLAIEEQYYIAWPLLLGLALSWPGARRRPQRAFVVLGVAIVLGSLAWSVWSTGTRPALAYFSTFTRAWELGLGGLLAVALRGRVLAPGMRDGLGGLGLLMILGSMLAFDGTTPFPGTAALWPVLGTMAVLAAAGPVRRFSAHGLLNAPVLQYLGDISYSLYLWHWPLIVLHRSVIGREPGAVDGVVLLAAAVVLAHASKVGIEDRFRSAGVPDGARRRVPAAALAVACIAVSLGAAGAGAAWRANRLVEEGPGFASHPGAAVLIGDIDAVGDTLLPAPDAAHDDLPAALGDGCAGAVTAASCHYGPADAAIRVALVGDDGAAQWQPALELLAQENDWRLSLFTNPDCTLGDLAAPGGGPESGDACRAWHADVGAALRDGGFRLVILAQSADRPVEGVASEMDRIETLAAGVQAAALALAARGIPVALVRAAPALRGACADAARLRECGLAREEAVAAHDPMTVSAARLPGVPLLDLTDAICTSERCAGVVGNVVVYRGDGGLTATYARSLAPAFAARLQGIAGLGAVAAPAPADVVRYDNLGVLASRAGRDDPDLYRDDCHADQASESPDFCLYGDPASAVRIALVGDSHAAQWLPLLQAHAEREGWALYSFTKSACTFSDAMVVIEGREYRACAAWNHNLVARLRELRPTVVVTSQSRGHHAYGVTDADADQRALAEGLLSRWRHLRDAGMRVLVIADTPWMRVHVPDCLAARPARGDGCDTGLAEATGMPDPILLAMKSAPDVVFADLNPYICTKTACPAISAGQVVWRDQHHLTASYSRRLAPHLAPALRRALAPPGPADPPPGATAP